MRNPRGHTGQMGRTGTAVLQPELEAFCQAAYSRLLGALILQCGDQAAAEELVQDTLVRVIDRWDQVSDMAYPMSWAHRVAYNLANSHFRRRAAERRAYGRQSQRRDLDWTTVDPDSADAVAIRRAVARLPERQRCALTLRYYGDLPVDAVAEAMGITTGSVKVFTSRALAALREDLGLTTDAVEPPTRTPARGPQTVDTGPMADRARRRQRIRRAGQALVGILVVGIAIALGMRFSDASRIPEIVTPDELQDSSWGPGIVRDLPPVVNAFLPTPPLVEAAGSLWTADPDGGAVLVQRDPADGNASATVVLTTTDATVCYVEEAGDDRLVLAVLCDPSSQGRRPLAVSLVDAEAGELVATVDRPPWNSVGDNVEYLAGAIWTAGREELVRIDPETGAAQTFTLPAGTFPRGATSAAGSLWLSTASLPDTDPAATGEVLRIDPETGEVITRVALGDAARSADAPASIAFLPWSLAATDEEVWVELAGEGRIARIDTVTGAVTDHIEVGAPSGTGQSPAALGRSQPIVGSNGLWVLVGDRLHLIDTTSGAIAVTISAPVRDASHVSGAAVTDRGDVWFGDWDRLVTIQTQRGG